jgi:tripartite-type tricarboxylate transporter receptor subunit TctC
VPAGTPPAIVERLNREIEVVLSDRDIARRMTELAIAPIIETPAELARRIADEQQKWKRVIERMAK